MKSGKKFFKALGTVVLCVVLLLIFLLIYCVCVLKSSTRNLKRVNDEGTLYYVEFTGDCYNPVVDLPFTFIRGAGCSAFYTENENGDALTCRNYDYEHFDKEGNLTGLNIIIKCEPEGKYKSIGTADATWLPGNMTAGSLEDSAFNRMLLGFLPFVTMDGMNEKGLCASILALDTKAGETPVNQDAKGKPDTCIPELLRYILNECATVEEAVEMAQNYNMKSLFGCDYHLFVTDAFGKSAVLEWRYDELTVEYTDAVTNFYVGYDDACDCYYGEELKERFDNPPSTSKAYNYGYGHGFQRFFSIVDALDKNVAGSDSLIRTQMSDEKAQNVLRSVAQTYEGGLTSMTQFGCVYNANTKTLDIFVWPDYMKEYEFCIFE